MLTQLPLMIATSGRGLVNITDEIQAVVKEENIAQGLCHLFLHHTSASLIITENADPQVLRDLEAFMQRFIPDGDKLFKHIDEGLDDMPSHMRSVLTQTFLVLPITNYQLGLGRWQGIYLWEHRLKGHQRKLTVTLQSV